VQADTEHQQDNAEFSQLRGQVGIGNETGGKRAGSTPAIR